MPERSCQAVEQLNTVLAFSRWRLCRLGQVDEELLVHFAESDGCLVALAVFKTVVGPFCGSG